MSRLADYSKFDNLDDGSDEDVTPQRRDAPPPPGTEPGPARCDAKPPPGTEPGPARYYKRVQVGCVLVRDYGAGAGTPADRLLALTLLRRYGPRIKGKRVVELGAQAGAAGLTAAKMGAAWVSLVSDDPRAAYALRVESVKNGVSRAVKNVCTDWLEDDLNGDVAADPTDLLVAANALHSPRECGRLAAALNAYAKTSPHLAAVVASPRCGSGAEAKGLQIMEARGWTYAAVEIHPDDAEPTPPGHALAVFEFARRTTFTPKRPRDGGDDLRPRDETTTVVS